MKCSRCAADIPAQSKFCLRCGSAVQTGTTGAMPSASRSFAQPKSANRTPYVIIGLLALAVLALGAVVVNGQLAQRAGKNESGKLVQAAGSGAGGPLLQVPGEAGKPQPLVEKPVAPPENAPVPADVLDYLAWLKQITRKRNDIMASVMNKAMVAVPVGSRDRIRSFTDFENSDASGGMDQADPRRTLKPVNDLSDKFTQDWNALASEFVQRTPPVSCKELHARYYEHLNVAGHDTVQFLTTLSKAMSNPSPEVAQELMALLPARGKREEAIRAADQALTEVCRNFKVTKDFEINDPQGGMSFTGLLSGLGLQ